MPGAGTTGYAKDILRDVLKADAAIASYLAERKPALPLRLRVVVEDVSDGAAVGAPTRIAEVEGEVRP